ncbi:MAG TPA: sugar phosphate isomerase/epimerase [Blastocatellia bacterium]|nr:sugar phosphate isomerase/epimerase [Blastocatellia bacterium]
MSELTRREWSKLALGGLAASVVNVGSAGGASKPDSKFHGVQVGVQSYSFRDRSLDDAIKAMVEIGLSSCELWQAHVEPPRERFAREPNPREALRKWRLTVPMDEFKAVRAKFDRAGIDLYAYNLSFRDDFSDEEIARGFEMALALGVKVITASSNVSTAKRVDPFAKRARMRVGMHNHSNIRPNEFATPDNFVEAMKGTSEYIAINLDIGHFTAANFNAVDFLKQNHGRIVTLHLKDRKRNQGDNVPFGEGDTPIKAVLTALREGKWKIPANIEYEYKGVDTVAEVRKSLAYCKQALGG